MDQDGRDLGLGRRLRALRRRAGLSATALAGDTLSVATVSRLEHGAVLPSLATLRYLAGRLGCAPADLLGPDPRSAELQGVLAELEAWLLLEAPLPAERRARTLLADWEGEGAAPPDAEITDLLEQVRAALARAEAVLDPAGAAALDPLLAAARRRGDAWAVARLALARAPSLEPEEAAALLRAALAALPEGAGDAPEERALRAAVLRRFGALQEAAGAVETARSLYRQAVAAAEPCCRPAHLARQLLADPSPLPPQPAGATPPPRSLSSPPALPVPPSPRRPVPPPPALLLAALAAGQQTWREGTLALARLDVRAGRLGEAARRLRHAQAGGPPDEAGMAAATDFWAELGRTLGPGRDDAWLRDRVAALPVADRAAADALVVIEVALLAGRLEEAETQAALLASDPALPPELALALRQRLALAWADAGNAPRAARALRAGRLS